MLLVLESSDVINYLRSKFLPLAVQSRLLCRVTDSVHCQQHGYPSTLHLRNLGRFRYCNYSRMTQRVCCFGVARVTW